MLRNVKYRKPAENPDGEVHVRTQFHEKKVFCICIPCLIILILAMIGILWYTGQRNNSDLSDSSSHEDEPEWTIDEEQQGIFSSGWRTILQSGNYTGIWLGCYRRLCRNDLSEAEYGREELRDIVESLSSKLGTIVVNPPNPIFNRIPPGEDESEDRGNTRIPALVAQENENSSRTTNVILTFTNKTGPWQVSNFDMAKYMADSGNRIHPGTVTTLVYKAGLLHDFSQIGDIHNTLEVLRSVRGQLKNGIRQGTPYKLGLIIDRNDCLKQLREIIDDILPFVDVIVYRGQHDYYQYHAPSRQGSKKERVTYQQQQIQSADPTPYHNKMISDLSQCEAALKREKAELEFLPVINCDKYWRQNYINWITHENQNLENLVKCWSLASIWARRNKRQVVLLLDREIEKHGWLPFLEHHHHHDHHHDHHD